MALQSWFFSTVVSFYSYVDISVLLELMLVIYKETLSCDIISSGSSSSASVSPVPGHRDQMLAVVGELDPGDDLCETRNMATRVKSTVIPEKHKNK